MGNYKVTALRDVTLWAAVDARRMQPLGDTQISVPAQERKWVSLRAGEVREDFGLIFGFRPQDCPGEPTLSSPGQPPLVDAGSYADSELPKEIRGLIRVERTAA